MARIQISKMKVDDPTVNFSLEIAADGHRPHMLPEKFHIRVGIIDKTGTIIPGMSHYFELTEHYSGGTQAFDISESYNCEQYVEGIELEVIINIRQNGVIKHEQSYPAITGGA